MGLRFRKTFKLAPGVRMTFGSGGTSFNFGPRGSSISVGKRGVYSNVSALGFTSRSKLSVSETRGSNQRRGGSVQSEPTIVRPATMTALARVQEDGTLYF